MIVGITGSSGFFGSNLLGHFRTSSHKTKQFDRDVYSLEDRESLIKFVNGTDVVVHMAGVSKNSTDDVIENVNVKGTENLCEAIVSSSPHTKLIFISSFQVYSPNDTFGKSKRDAEDVINTYIAKQGLHASVLRFSNLYGIGCPPFKHSVISTFIQLAKTNQPITLYGNGEQQRDFLYVSDASLAILKLITSKIEIREPLNICTGRMVSLRFVLDVIQNFTGTEIEVYNKPLVEKSDYQVKFNYDRAYELIDWKPAISLEQGLKKILRSEFSIR